MPGINQHASARPLKVMADRRWPLQTGIGKVQTELEARLPFGMEIVDLDVKGGIGSPLSPVSISKALMGHNNGVFFSAGFVPPLWAKVNCVVVVHDLTHRYFYGVAQRAYYDYVYKPLYRRCAAIICVSEFTRQEFISWSGMAEDKVHLAYNGCDQRFAEEGERFDPGYPYVFYGGNHRPYKNLDRLLKGYAASSLPSNGVKLLLTGARNEELVRLAEQLSISDSVIFLGRVAEELMPALYRGALAVSYLSLFEGFGLPIIEAFSCGVPVITSASSAMKEVAADAALVVDPTDVTEIANGLDQVAMDSATRARLIERGRLRKLDFDWDASAAKVWALVNEAAGPI
jgi:glycosyltransferase involved in cell wall biosynthesis